MLRFESNEKLWAFSKWFSCCGIGRRFSIRIALFANIAIKRKLIATINRVIDRGSQWCATEKWVIRI